MSCRDQTVFYLYSFLALEGKWVWEPRAHSNLWLVLGEIKVTRPPLHLIQRVLYYDDSRHQGQINFFGSPDELDVKLKKLGPDILANALFDRGELPDLPVSEHITAGSWQTIFRNPRLRTKRLCEFLLDQARFCGIGNYIRAEIMYMTRLSPYRTLESLQDREIEAIRQSAIDIMYRSYKSQGHTFSSFVNTHGDKGEFKCVIYQKRQCPLGHPIVQESDKQGRTIHWVPALQQ
jgi:formamidopyrimidine-DNA glycosylase